MDYIQSLTQQEADRQKNTLNLIASENYPSPKVLSLLGSVWSNKYGEGYPGKRYYAGNQNTDLLESFVQAKALEVYQATDYEVNLQVLSGSPANSMVFLSVLNYQDTIMSLNLANGGHLSHLHQTSNWNKFFKHINYDVTEVAPGDYQVDIADFEQKLKTHKPKLVIIGFSAYPKTYKFGEMCRIAHQHGAFVLADIAHINGLVAAGLHDSPFGTDEFSADFVSMTTHKTFRGPRGAMLFSKNHVPEYLQQHFASLSKPPKSLAEIINRTIFPGTSGGPHFNKIAAIGQACLEILGQDEYPNKINFKAYSQSVLDNTKQLENGLKSAGLQIISPTQNHLCLVKLPEELDSLDFQKELEQLGIISNRNSIPFDQKSPWRPSGMRFGMAALTSREISSKHSFELGELIGKVALKNIAKNEATSKVEEIVGSLSWFY